MSRRSGRPAVCYRMGAGGAAGYRRNDRQQEVVYVSLQRHACFSGPGYRARLEVPCGRGLRGCATTMTDHRAKDAVGIGCRSSPCQLQGIEAKTRKTIGADEARHLCCPRGTLGSNRTHGQGARASNLDEHTNAKAADQCPGSRYVVWTRWLTWVTRTSRRGHRTGPRV